VQPQRHVQVQRDVGLAPVLAEDRADPRQPLVERVGVDVQALGRRPVLAAAGEVLLQRVRQVCAARRVVVEERADRPPYELGCLIGTAWREQEAVDAQHLGAADDAAPAEGEQGGQAPAGGGERVDAGGTEVVVVTPQSPLGASLLGARVGDELEGEIGAKRRTVLVEWLR
jgi:hypothetical protein